jgi:CheY-like chemotaxis protein
MSKDRDGFALAKRIRQDPQLDSAIIMMLTSTEQGEDAARCRQLGISAYLVKPIRKAELLSSILNILGPRALAETKVKETPKQMDSGLRILLVEDNPVNQTVGLRMLEKMGHNAELARNGQEALERIVEQEFDVVLMDVQMPEMDGLTATPHIRASEKKLGGHLPIIAIGARHARRTENLPGRRNGRLFIKANQPGGIGSSDRRTNESPCSSRPSTCGRIRDQTRRSLRGGRMGRSKVLGKDWQR